MPTDTRNADPRTADLLVQAQYAAAAVELARLTVGTAFLPDSLKVWLDPEKAKGDNADHSLANTDVDATVSQAALAIVKGTALGFDWIASLEAVVVINNRPFLTALALRALVLRTPFLRIEVVDSTSQRAVVMGWRRGDDGEWGEPQTSTWTMDRARAAKFRGMHGQYSTWQTMPQNMLEARATAECARRIGADVILGIGYIAEEADSFGEYDAESPNGAEPAPPGTPALPAGSRPSRTRRRPPPPPGAGTDNPSHGRGDGQGTGDDAPSVDDQRTMIASGLAKLGITTNADKRAKVNEWLGLKGNKQVGRMTALTVGQARTVLARIDAELRIAAQNATTGNGPGAAEDGGEAAGGEPADTGNDDDDPEGSPAE